MTTQTTIPQLYTIPEILAKVRSGDYNAEMMLQHLLARCSELEDAIRAAEIMFCTDGISDGEVAAEMFRILQTASRPATYQPNPSTPPPSISATGELSIDSEDGGYATPSMSIQTGPKEWVELHEMAQTLIGRPGFEWGKTGVNVEVTMRIVPATCQPTLDTPK